MVARFNYSNYCDLFVMYPHEVKHNFVGIGFNYFTLNIILMNCLFMIKNFIFLFCSVTTLYQLNAQSCAVSTISTVDGRNTIYTCPTDGNNDVFQFINEGANPNANFRYVATDDAFNIIGLPPADRIDFEGAGDGVCYVWGFNFTGNVLAQVGQNIFSTPFSDGCYAISRTAVSVVRSQPDGGNVAMPSGATERTVCTTDGYNDVIIFTNNSTSKAQYRYIITDDQNNILGLPPSNSLNFEGVFPGICRVWGLSYTGNLTAQLGDNAADVALSDDCFDLSNNFITVNRINVDGGTVSTIDGAKAITTRVNDGIADVVAFMHESSSNARFTYIVTDENNQIIGTPPSNMVNFEGAGVGICRVWGVSYTGELNFLLGGTLGNFALSTGCFDISNEFVTVNRIVNLSGGTIAMPDGNSIRYTCPGDGIADIVRFVSTNATVGANFVYVITDEQGNILGLPTTAEANLEGAGEGICLVWGLTYTGNLTARVGQNALNIALSDGEFALSNNVITVNRFMPDGGDVSTSSATTEVTIVAGDSTDDIIEFVSTNTSISRFSFVVTDQNGVILGLPSGNSVNFEQAGVGVCLIWGLSYTGQLTAKLGDNALQTPLSSECFDLSNTFVTVNRVGSRTVNIALNANNNAVLNLFPNPATESINIQLTNRIPENAFVNIFDQLGRLVAQQNTALVDGFNQIELYVTDLASGIYFIEIQTTSNKQQLRFIKE